MGRNSDLSTEEKFSIKILKGLGISITKIAISLNRHKSTISRYLNGCQESRRMNCGRKRILDNRSLRRVSRMIDKKAVSANYLIKSLHLRCSDQTLRVAMKNNNIYWTKTKFQIPLSKINKSRRIEFCREAICNNVQWNDIIFSDEKRFCLDGLENPIYAWSKKIKTTF